MNRKILRIIAVGVLALTLAACGTKEEVSEAPDESEAAVKHPISAVDELNPENTYKVKVIHADDENYPEEMLADDRTRRFLLDDSMDVLYKNCPEEVVLAANGEIVPSPMSRSVVSSNRRYITWKTVYNDWNVQFSCEAGGPNIVINGYAVPDADFFAANINGIAQGYFFTYNIRKAALIMAGIEPIENNPNVIGVDGFLSDPDEKDVDTILMSAVERDVSFTLESFDNETNTYYFSAEHKGPASGTSNYFYGLTGLYIPGGKIPGISPPVALKSFPTRYCNIDDHPKEWVVSQYNTQADGVEYDPSNTYWSNLNITRDEVRETYNEQFDTHYEPLNYNDVPGNTTRCWKVFVPNTIGIKEKLSE